MAESLSRSPSAKLVQPGAHFSQRAARQSLAGWGNFPVEECEVYRPELLADLQEVVARAPDRDLIARGLGRSYGDAALNRDRGVILSQRFDHMLDFDTRSGVLHCQSAVSLAQIIEVFLPRGFFFPVTPGTKFISIGGAIAADVHGKNHHTSGSMGEFVLDFRLLTAAGTVLECSREENSDVFWATIGGMGLTGVILDARVQLQPVETAYMNVQNERAADLDSVLERFFEGDDAFSYAVAWLDCLSKGRSLGRSILMRANHARLQDLPAPLRDEPCVFREGIKPTVPFTFPGFALSPYSVKLFNAAFHATHPDASKLVGCDSYFYVLDRVHHWNRIYGRRGVVQYQIALPPESSRSALIEILERLNQTKRGSFLAVLKTLGPASQGLLSFPTRGCTLALDLPNTGRDLVEDLQQIDQIVLRAGGRIYLAKDACMLPEVFEQMYPSLDRFRAIKAKIDPERRFSSSQSRRLRIAEHT
ncbi:MAG: FAD-binding oxidoreductase [Deltaproteobacteria bacterium]|nr:FAD-binding oxidoreductase [Deltaproteobacteria bacterium]MBW2724908.1 FAD-binding oxidoreductase [Deltaproteobacteria bacterium]